MIAKTPQVTDLVADRKSDVALLPSFNALGNGKSVVECEDLFVAPLASAKFKEAFITEVTPPAAIAMKTVCVVVFFDFDPPGSDPSYIADTR